MKRLEFFMGTCKTRSSLKFNSRTVVAPKICNNLQDNSLPNPKLLANDTLLFLIDSHYYTLLSNILNDDLYSIRNKAFNNNNPIKQAQEVIFLHKTMRFVLINK